MPHQYRLWRHPHPAVLHHRLSRQRGQRRGALLAVRACSLLHSGRLFVLGLRCCCRPTCRPTPSSPSSAAWWMLVTSGPPWALPSWVSTCSWADMHRKHIMRCTCVQCAHAGGSAPMSEACRRAGGMPLARASVLRAAQLPCTSPCPGPASVLANHRCAPSCSSCRQVLVRPQDVSHK